MRFLKPAFKVAVSLVLIEIVMHVFEQRSSGLW